ncbi:MAG: Sister chromatid cohesion protein 2 [Peltula sp. TS41687]|nr:MAG: Sister chromatid cohesion protein 2 [Peltula sp. TS41687]
MDEDPEAPPHINLNGFLDFISESYTLLTWHAAKQLSETASCMVTPGPESTCRIANKLIAEDGTSKTALRIRWSGVLKWGAVMEWKKTTYNPVPIPAIRGPNSTTLFTSSAERTAARQTLEILNREAYQSNNQVNLATHTVQDLQQFLDSGRLPEYRFKCPPGFNINQASSPPVAQGNGISATLSSIGPFAEMVLSSTNVNFCYPTPSTPSTFSATGFSAQINASPSRNKSSKRKRDSDATVLSDIQGKRIAISIHDKPQPVVVVPALPPSSQPEDYRVFLEPASEEDDVKLKRYGERKGQDSIVRGTDDKKKAKSCVRALQELISRIFEAEDHLQLDTSALVALTATEYFVPDDSTEGTGHILAPATQSELEILVEKVNQYGVLREISSDAITRLQKIFEGSLRAAEGADIKISDILDEERLENWRQNLDTVETGLRSAKTLLSMVTAGRRETQVYSEEVLQVTLDLLKSIVESLIVPVVGLRSSGSSAELFKAASTQKKVILPIITYTIKILQLLSHLLAGEILTERAITAIEFLATSLIFTENAHTDKDSVLGVRKGERLRVVAMNVLVQTFSRYPDHRTFIFDEILTSLEKLPSSRQKARQYKLDDGRSIQLVSALILKLVQTSVKVDDERSSRSTKRSTQANGDTPEDGDGAEEQKLSETEKTTESANNAKKSSQELLDTVQFLIGTAQKNAQYVIQFLVSRGLKSTKTGDDPYRVLLDIFTEDFLAVLDLVEWPASELLLRSLLANMIGLAEGEKTIAPARNLALDLMGLMGATLSNLVSHLRHNCKSLDPAESLDIQLAKLSDEFIAAKTEEIDSLDLTAMYCIVLEHLDQEESSAEMSHVVKDFHTLQWAFKRHCSHDSLHVEMGDVRINQAPTALTDSLRAMMVEEVNFDKRKSKLITSAQARVAYPLVVLNMPFGKAYERILLILLNSLNSDQATVRSKGLKCVIQLIEKDPTILDRGSYVTRYIVSRTSDPSPLVRDSALGLVSRCLTLKPELEEVLTQPILARTMDSQVGVRKRSMKILKEVFLRNLNQDIRAAIADAFLHRISDAEESVSELATQLLEEIWISPFSSPFDDEHEALQRGLAMRDEVSLIRRTLQRGGNTSTVLGSFLQGILSEGSKNSAANFRVCKDMVAVMFNEIIDSEDQSEHTTRHVIMQALTVFAKANAMLFSAEQLEHLQIYIEHLSHNEDLHMFRSVVVVFRWVLPHLSNMKAKFLTAVQKALLESLTKLGKRELSEVIPCLWTINGSLNTIERLSKVTVSCIKGILSAKGADLHQESQKRLATSVVRYVNIAGLLGRYCDFDGDLPRFQKEFPWWKGDSVLTLLIDVFAPFTNPKQPLSVRTAALDGYGAVSQRWPKLFLREQVTTAFDMVFAEGNSELEKLVLTNFKEFLSSEEKPSDTDATLPSNSGEDAQSSRLAGTSAASQIDGVATSIAQRYHQHAIRIALTSQDSYALLATEFIAVINRLGLVHPKECIPALVALTTSKNTAISKTASREHRMLHQKHETIVEKEYMKAVQQTFEYQRDIVKDVRGVTLPPPASKLQPLYDVIKTSKVRSRKRFLENLCARMDFSLSTLAINDDIPTHLQLSRFITENLALFEYGTLDELHYVISSMERLVSGTGTIIAHVLETEVFPAPTQPSTDQSLEHGQPTGPRLRLLATSSLILSLVWETRTFLRRLYGIHSLATTAPKRETKTSGGSNAKGSSKDLNKPPTKHAGGGVTPQSFLDKATDEKITALFGTDDAMLSTCRAFLDLMTVDQELKVAANNDAIGEDANDNTAEMLHAHTAAGQDTPGGEAGTPAPHLPLPMPQSGGGAGGKRKRKSTGAAVAVAGGGGANKPAGKKQRRRRSSVASVVAGGGGEGGGGKGSMTMAMVGYDEAVGEVDADGDEEYWE